MNNEAIRLQRICAIHTAHRLSTGHAFSEEAIACDQEVSAMFYRKARVAAGVETMALTYSEAMYVALRFNNFRLPIGCPVKWLNYQIGDNTTVSFHHNGRVGVAVGGEVVENYADVEDFKFMYDLIERA